MIGIINIDESTLNDICIRLDNALKNSALIYNAEKYADLIEYPDGSKYALPISENQKYYDIIILTLTQSEIDKIETIGADWYPEIV